MKTAIILFVVIAVGALVWALFRTRQTHGTLPLPETGATHKHFVYAKIFDPIDPLARGSKYEDPLNAMLEAQHFGEITGGGTMQNKDGSIQFIGLDIELTDLAGALQATRTKLRELGAPKDSVLEYQQDAKTIILPIHDK